MDPADLAMYALYIGIFISPIQILVELVEMIQKGFSGFRRFLDVMDTRPTIKDEPGAPVSYTHLSPAPSQSLPVISGVCTYTNPLS